MRKHWLPITALISSGLFLALGIVRASNTDFQKKRDILLQACQAEQKKLGINNTATLFGKYPTPEIALSRMVRIVPGATGEIVVRGKFQPNTKFLFDNDSVSVLKESATATEYRATVQIGDIAGPSFSALYAFAPVSGANLSTAAIYIGGKYEWNLTTANGWQIKMHPLDEQFTPSATSPPRPRFSVEFYKGGDAKPFQTMELALDINSAAENDTYSGSLGVSAGGGAGDPTAELQSIGKKMSDPNLPPAERQKLMQRMMVLSQQMSSQATNAVANAQKLQQQQAEFGCNNISLHLKGTDVDGEVACGENVGRPKLTGTIRMAGQ
jgi:hypothetical protein